MKKWLHIFVIGIVLLSFAPTSQAATLQDNDSFYKTQVFPDVSPSASYYKAVQWAYHNKIISGSNGKFNPTDTLKEAQFAKMFAEFFQFPMSTQQNSNDWTATYYNRLIAYDVPLNGYNSTTVRNQPINRGLVARMIAHALGQKSDLASAVTYLMETGISTGQNLNETDPVKRFGASNTLTRSQAAAFLYRMYDKGYVELKATATSNAGTNNPTNSKEYFMGGAVTARVVNNDYKSYELEFVSDNQVIGGYLTKDGATFEGYTIGSALSGNKNVEKNGKKIAIFVDTHAKNKIDAIYWTEDSSSADLKLKALQNDTSAKKYEQLARLMVEITNVSRAKAGVATLTYDTKVAAVAKAHSVDMVTNKYFAHNSLNGSTPFDRMEAAGLDYRTAGENLADGHSTIFHAHNGLFNSPGHRKNILNKEFKHAGVGIENRTYTMNFITY
ncbi:CAP domain-containing protein [Lysinibacillus sp. LZ02]|uniref:CAP and S-layer homology domain-containing protein n=1 Tax=Lysinibacillus sp. LZ02 TaxID=3420668 RepID=UPI003D36A65A